MKTRKLGTTDLNLTEIGIGTWAIGGEGWDYAWGPQNDDDSIAAILEGLEAGINWIDTAAVYGLGRSESMVGKALKEWKFPVFVATKCGLFGDSEGHVSGNLKKESIFKEAETSLIRLGLECIDLYQIHWPNPSSDIEEAFSALQTLKQQGKIRYAAVSNFSVKQMNKISPLGKIASVQSPFSILNTYIEKDIIPYCEKNKIGVLCYSPLQCGILTDKMSKEWVENLSEGDWRKSKLNLLQEPKLSQTLELVNRLKEFASRHNKSISDLALAWVLSKNITSAIVGIRKPGQISSLLKATEWVLDSSLLSSLNETIRLSHKA